MMHSKKSPTRLNAVPLNSSQPTGFSQSSQILQQQSSKTLLQSSKLGSQSKLATQTAFQG